MGAVALQEHPHRPADDAVGDQAFNAFNTPIYNGPNTDPNNVRFGQITPDQINFPRQVQIRVRVLF